MRFCAKYTFSRSFVSDCVLLDQTENTGDVIGHSLVYSDTLSAPLFYTLFVLFRSIGLFFCELLAFDGYDSEHCCLSCELSAECQAIL